MKTSNKILLISSTSLIGMVIVFLIIFRLMLGNNITTEKPKDSDKPSVSREFPLTDFTGIKVSGHWEVKNIPKAVQAYRIMVEQGDVHFINLERKTPDIAEKEEEIQRGSRKSLVESIANFFTGLFGVSRLCTGSRPYMERRD